MSLEDDDAICRCLGDADPLVRWAAVDRFSVLKEKAQPQAKTVLQALSSQDGCQRCAAALALAHIGEKAAAPDIAKLLDDSFVDEDSARLYMACVIEKPPAYMRVARCAACMALSMLGEAGAAFADSVAALLSSDNVESWEVREAALQALGNMGSEGAKHVEKVFEFIDSKEAYVASAAMLALGQMSASLEGLSEEMVDAVAKKLCSTNPIVRANAASALSTMGSAAVEWYLDDLAKCFEDRCPAVKIAAMYAFTKLGKAGQAFAPAIAGMLEDESCKVRVAAIDSLSLMGERGAALADEIGQYLQDPEGDVRAAAVKALGKFGERASHLRPYLDSMANDSVDSVRSAAAEAVDLIPPALDAA